MSSGPSPNSKNRRRRSPSLAPENIRILVVEPDAVLTKHVLAYAKASNYDGTSVANGHEALDRLVEGPSLYHCVLCDVSTPTLPAILHLLKAMREHEILCDLPVIIMSTAEENGLAYQCLKSGADDHFIKPVRQDLIAGLWQRVWRKRREREVVRKLDEERRKRIEYEEQVGYLKTQVETAIETPVSIISKTVGELIQSDGLTEQVRNALTGILGALHSSDGLYQPAFDKVLSRDDIDQETKEWLTGMLVPGAESDKGRHTREPTPNKEVVDMFASTSTHTTDRDLLDTLGSFDFDVWSYKESELYDLVQEIFYDLDLMTTFNISPATLQQFLTVLRQSYHNNPYHNFRHAFDVTQMVYWFLRTADARSLLKPIEVFALVVSALCHDVDHPGLNNMFHVNIASPLALRYNDVSVLEHHHASFTFALLRGADTNITEHMSHEDYREFRAIVIKCILATDMAVHMEVLAKFDSIVGGFDKDNIEDRRLLMEIILKCADISNPTRPFGISQYWADMIEEEWYMQGDLERALQIPISPLMDRESGNQQAKVSLTFANFVVKPLYTSVIQVLPRAQVCMDSLIANLAKWTTLQEEITATEGEEFAKTDLGDIVEEEEEEEGED